MSADGLLALLAIVAVLMNEKVTASITFRKYAREERSLV
jgi:hypothetical protein